MSLHCGRPGLPRFEEASVIDGQHPRPGPSSAKVFDSNVSPARDGGNVFVTCVEVGTTSQPPGIRHVSRIQLTLRGEERHPSILGPGALRALSNASNFSSWPGASSTKGFHSNVSSFTPRASGPREWKHVLYLRESWGLLPSLPESDTYQEYNLRGGKKDTLQFSGREPSGRFPTHPTFPPGPEPPPRKVSTPTFHLSRREPRGPREWKHVLYLRESWAYFLIRHVSRIQLTLRGEERHPSILGPGALRAPSNAVKFPPGPEPPPRKLSTYSKLFFFQVKSLRLFTGNMFVACGEIGTSSWPPRNTTSVTRWGLLWDNGMY